MAMNELEMFLNAWDREAESTLKHVQGHWRAPVRFNKTSRESAASWRVK